MAAPKKLQDIHEHEHRLENLERRMDIMEALHAETLRQLERARNPQPLPVEVKRHDPEQVKG